MSRLTHSHLSKHMESAEFIMQCVADYVYLAGNHSTRDTQIRDLAQEPGSKCTAAALVRVL